MIKRLFFLFLFTLFFISYSNTVKAESTIYKMDVQIDSRQRIVYGTSEITIFNTTSQSLKSIYFNLGMNNNYDTKMKVIEVKDKKGNTIPGDFYRYNYLENEKTDRTLFKLNLNKELESGESIILIIKFEVSNLSKINGILVLDDNIFDEYIGSWYPRLTGMSDGKWNKNDFSSNNYDINFSVFGDENICTPALELENTLLKSKNQRVISYRIDNARSFSLAVGKNISFDSDKVDKVMVKTYFHTNKPNIGIREIRELTKDITGFYNSKIGPLLNNNLNIFPGISYKIDGYANNGFIVLENTPDSLKTAKQVENYFRWNLAYLIAKQYFGYGVHEDGRYPKWITSGSAIYLASLYMKEKNLSPEYFNSVISEYITAASSNFNTKILQSTDELKYGNFDWQKVIEEGKSVQIFKMLESNLGKKTLISILKDVYIKKYAGKIDLESFQDICENVSKKKLDWFFTQWVKENKRLDYAVTRITLNKKQDKYQAKISLKNFGDAVMPVSITVTLKNGSRVFHFWDGKDDETELTFEYPETVRYVQLDPAGVLPDIDLTNNKKSPVSF